MEHVDDVVEGRELYIPRKGVVQENVESTKMDIVYDTSDKASAFNERMPVNWTTLAKSIGERADKEQIPPSGNC